MRPLQEPQPPTLAPTPAPSPLQEITFDIGEFLGDQLPTDQLLLSVLEAPPASVPAAAPPPAPAAAAGQSGLTERRLTAEQRAQLARGRRLMAALPPPPPGLPRQAALRVMFQYALAQQRSRIDENILLHKLAKKNNATELRRIAKLMIDLKHQTNIHTKNRHGETPLHLAKGAAAARVLLECGARLDAIDRLGNTPIHLAARDQRVETLAALLEWRQVDFRVLDMKNLEGYTALHLVVIHQPISDPHRRALQLFIQESADLNIADDTGGRSALFHAVLRGDELTVRYLVESGAAVNNADFSETTPLQAAEDVLPANDNYICSILLERGGFKVPPADRVTQSGRRGGGRGRAR